MKRIAVSIFLLALSACSASSLLAPSGSPAKLYTLSTPQNVVVSAPRADWQLLVDVPAAQLGLNTPRIATRPEPSRLDYYANVAWEDRPPVILQGLLLRAFENSQKIAAVDRQTGRVRADFTLDSELHDFQAEESAGTVHVGISARLVRARDRTIVASRDFEASVPISSGIDGIIAGFEGALGQLLPQIVDWTLNEGSRNS